MQHRHSCVDIRVVLDQIAAVVLPMKDDKDDSNDNQDGGDVYSTMTCNERDVGRAIPATRAMPRMRSADNVYQSRQ